MVHAVFKWEGYQYVWNAVTVGQLLAICRKQRILVQERLSSSIRLENILALWSEYSNCNSSASCCSTTVEQCVAACSLVLYETVVMFKLLNICAVMVSHLSVPGVGIRLSVCLKSQPIHWPFPESNIRLLHHKLRWWVLLLRACAVKKLSRCTIYTVRYIVQGTDEL
jgi:hypothetical protein